MSTNPVKFTFPKIFRRLPNQKHPSASRLIKLRESKHERLQNGTCIVQGLHALRFLRDEGFSIRSLIVTAESEPHDESAIKFPANQVIKNPDAFPAERYYLMDVDLTRRTLGTGARPGRHEIFGEVVTKSLPIPEDTDRMMIFNHVNDPAQLGILVRTGYGLGWNASISTTPISDMYNDTTIRASRQLSLLMPHKIMPVKDLTEFLKERQITPIIAKPLLHKKPHDLWSPLGAQEPTPGSGLWFWNFGDKKQELPKRVALVMNADNNGEKSVRLDDALHVSVPTRPGAPHLNVTSIGSMIMFELNRLMVTKK